MPGDYLGRSGRSSVCHSVMSVAPKKLDVHVGDFLEIEDHLYELMPDRHGGFTLEPAVTTTVSELDRRHRTRPATQEEIEAQLGCLPRA